MSISCKKCNYDVKRTQLKELCPESKYNVAKCRVCKIKLYFDENGKYVENHK